MATYPDPILNPTGLGAFELTPAAGNWRRELIDLNAFLTGGQIVVKFSYKSAAGGSILIDNILFNQTGTGLKEMYVPQVSISPNPATDQVTLRAGDEKIETVSIYDLAGRAIKTMPAGSATFQVPVAMLENGVYLFQIQTTKGKTGKKVIIQH